MLSKVTFDAAKGLCLCCLWFFLASAEMEAKQDEVNSVKIKRYRSKIAKNLSLLAPRCEPVNLGNSN